MTHFYLYDNQQHNKKRKKKERKCATYLFVSALVDHGEGAMPEHLAGVVLELSNLFHLVS